MILVYSCLAVESTTTSGYRVTPTPFGGSGVPAFPRGVRMGWLPAYGRRRHSRVSSGRWPKETRMGKRTGTAWTFPGNWSGHSPTHSRGVPSTPLAPRQRSPAAAPAAFQQHSPAGGEPAYRSAISAETNQAAWYGAKSMRGSRRSQEYPPRSSWASKPSRRARTSWRSATVSPVKL